MEADWEFEIGLDAPIIEAQWSGFVDLRTEPNRAVDLAETRQLPGLADALARLNSMRSPVWTCKTDVFVPDQIDPDELHATGEDASHSIACYVDLLLRSDQRWNSLSKAEHACTEVCMRLRDVRLSRCRVDLVVRRACIGSGVDDLGATAYLTACGPTECDARARLAECLSLFAGLIVSGLKSGPGC
jgi:hypothetical protein